MVYLVICKKCEWACEMFREGNRTWWTCSNCGEERISHWDFGTLDIEAIREGVYALEAEGNDFQIFEQQ